MQQHLIDLGNENPASPTCAKCGAALQPTSRTRGICPNCPDAKMMALPASMRGKYQQQARRANQKQKAAESLEYLAVKELVDRIKSGKIRIDVSGILGKKGGQS